MKNRSFNKIQETRGQALVELAIILPILTLLFLGVFDFSRAIYTKNMITNVSREGANLASRDSQLMQQDPQTVMNTLAETAQPLDMQNNGMIYITVVQGASSGNPTIQTQYPWANTNLKTTTQNGTVYNIQSRFGTQVSPNTSSLATLGLRVGQTASIVEVFYNYQSLFSVGKQFLHTPATLYSMAIF